MANKTSDIPGVEWVKESGDFIKIDIEKCIGCANCIKVCLGGCYTYSKKKHE